MKLSSKTQSLVYHFGEMGSRWGFNRTVGQIYALIVLSEESLNADQVMNTLSISRGNVSMGLKELQSWQLIRLQHRPGDRRDYYAAAGDVWDMARKVIEERRKREVEPTLSLLRDVLMDESQNESERYAHDRMSEIHDLLEMVTRWSEEMQSMKKENLQTLIKLGSGVGKVLEFKEKLKGRDKD